MGPITAVTTVLHTPGEALSNNASRLVRGEVEEDFLRARNLRVTTDDRPFHFDVDPARPEVKRVYATTFVFTLILLAFFVPVLGRQRSKLLNSLPLVLAAALTGLGFLLLEIVLIQRYELFLGSPVATFASVLGTLLIFSGLGSLWSRRIDTQGVYRSIAAIVVLLLIQQWMMPSVFPLAAALPLTMKIILSVITIAPLAFFLGVPFPFILRSSKSEIAESAAATMFGLNTAATALAVPLAIYLSMNWGFSVTFQIGIIIYGVVWLLILSLQRRGIGLVARWSTALVIVSLLAAPWLTARSSAGEEVDPNRHLVYGVSYGSSFFREDRVFVNGSSSDGVSFEWLFWIIETDGRRILVDTGFDDPDEAREWGIRDYVRPVERLAQLGISPLDVTDVILTHLHWDHVGNAAAYPNATIWLQSTEYEYAKSRLNPGNTRSKGMWWDHLQALLAAEAEGRLVLVNGEDTMMTGITMTPAGGHTPGSQFVTVETLDGAVVIAGDEAYLYRNNQSHVPIGSAYDHDANLAAIREMHRRAASPFLILPGHDPRVLSYFPEVSEGIVHVTTIPE